MTYRVLANGHTAADQLATSAKPLTFRYERHTVAFLVDGQITSVTEHYCISVLAIAVVTYGTLGILLFTLTNRLTVHCCSTTRAWAVCLWRFRVRLGDACRHVSFARGA